MITFGICTNYTNENMVHKCKDSISRMMPQDIQFEILIVGCKENWTISTPVRQVRRINTGNDKEFTRKKNIITQEALYDIIVYTHDYVSFDENWFWGLDWFSHLTTKSNTYSNVKTDWDLLMNIIKTEDGHRFRDWCVWDDYRYGGQWTQHEPWCPPEGITYNGRPCIVPYEYKHTERMYISGMYWVAKRQVMLDNPLREDLNWGQAEDIEWSLRVRDKYKYVLNPYSSCTLMKPKDIILPYVELTNE